MKFFFKLLVMTYKVINENFINNIYIYIIYISKHDSY